MFNVIDGRHRLFVAQQRKLTKLRCNVIDITGGEALRVIPIEELQVDPDVQIAFAFSKTKAMKMAKNFDERKFGVLSVTPTGRGSLSKENKARIKLGLDRDRRNVSQIESYLIELVAKDPTALAINKVVLKHGYEVKQGGKLGPNHYIAAISTLRAINRIEGRLERVLALNERFWFDQPTANTRVWLRALQIVVDEDVDIDLSETARQKLAELIPGRLIREGQGTVLVGGQTTASSFPVSAYVANEIMKTTKKQRRSRRELRKQEEEGSDGPSTDS